MNVELKKSTKPGRLGQIVGCECWNIKKHTQYEIFDKLRDKAPTNWRDGLAKLLGGL